MKREHTWRERHPFLYGLSQTFGIAPVRRYVPTVEESFRQALDDIEDAIAEAERRQTVAAVNPIINDEE